MVYLDHHTLERPPSQVACVLENAVAPVVTAVQVALLVPALVVEPQAFALVVLAPLALAQAQVRTVSWVPVSPSAVVPLAALVVAQEASP